jgi:hypothetical protein
MSRVAFLLTFLAGSLLSGCITTSMQGYADRQLPVGRVQRIATYVVAPVALATSFQSSLAEEAPKRGVVAEDGFALLPPTRTYNDAEIRKILAEASIDAVLIINVGDTGVVKEFAGTFFQGQYSGSSNASGTITRNGNFSNVSLSGTSEGTMTGTSTSTGGA